MQWKIETFSSYAKFGQSWLPSATVFDEKGEFVHQVTAETEDKAMEAAFDWINESKPNAYMILTQDVNVALVGFDS